MPLVERQGDTASVPSCRVASGTSWDFIATFCRRMRLLTNGLVVEWGLGGPGTGPAVDRLDGPLGPQQRSTCQGGLGLCCCVCPGIRPLVGPSLAVGTKVAQGFVWWVGQAAGASAVERGWV